MSSKFWMYYFVDAKLQPNHHFILMNGQEYVTSCKFGSDSFFLEPWGILLRLNAICIKEDDSKNEYRWYLLLISSLWIILIHSLVGRREMFCYSLLLCPFTIYQCQYLPQGHTWISWNDWVDVGVDCHENAWHW